VKINWLVWISVFFLAMGLRVSALDVGLSQVCLTPSEEYWLYNPYQLPSAYQPDLRWQVRDDVFVATGNTQRVFATEANDLLILRYLGILVGMLTVALSIRLARHLQSSWLGLFTMLVAVGTWFVVTDWFVVRYDMALLCVAIAVNLQLIARRRPLTITLSWAHDVSALALLWVASPLWWLSIVLLVLNPQRQWSRIGFILMAMFIMLPSMRLPVVWLEAAQSWDSGVGVVMVWLALVGAMLYWRKMVWWVNALGWLVVLFSIVLNLITLNNLPRPTETEWRVIQQVQNQIHNGALLELDRNTWHLTDAILCPMSADLQIQVRGENDVLSVRPYDYRLSTQDPLNPLPSDPILHRTDLGDGYLLFRRLDLPNPTTFAFGNQLYLLGYQIMTPQVLPEQVVDIRLDLQMSNQVNENITVLTAFVHITQVGSPGDKVFEMSLPLTEVLGDVTRREQNLNRHIRFSLPLRVPSGHYDVIFGVYNSVEGREEGRITLGQLSVSAP
jgi:hypothetical protein